LAEAVLSLYRLSGKPARAAFGTRAVRSVVRIAEALTEPELTIAVSRSTDVGALVEALQFHEAAIPDQSDNSLWPALLRGLERKQEILGRDGGTLGVGEIADFLQVSRQAIEKRRQRGTMLGLSLGSRGFRYPRWQFTDDGILEGLPDVLAALRENAVTEWMAAEFFVTTDEYLDGRTPIEALRNGELESVLLVASMFGEQGGR